MRTIQIPIYTDKLEVLHGQPNGRVFADALEDTCKHQYGAAFGVYAKAQADDITVSD
ncbi:hypothetical protein [Aeromonas caviae]|uniref:hypothetical protein n=1 Tax=Aeromonas caviae TaxID=648 RepID=UPI002B252D76|nr:hypothetical protein [Aeromonas caviae]MEA9428251.1 hypothetical protein [Aeromonas caviae]MEA9433646.1 hypothetical protein [Aeromonas caviae]